MISRSVLKNTKIQNLVLHENDFNVTPQIGINADSTSVKENGCVNINLSDKFEKYCNIDDACSNLQNIRMKSIDRVIIATLQKE